MTGTTRSTSPQDWDEAEKHAIDYPGDRVVQFSPASKAFLEIRSSDLRILERVHADARIPALHSGGSRLFYCKREFHMTDDVRSGLFRPRAQAERSGFAQDEFGNWIRGGWTENHRSRHTGDDTSAIYSADGLKCIPLGDISEVALPVYQGVMISPLCVSAASFEIASGDSSGHWTALPDGVYLPKPQYLMMASSYYSSLKRIPGLKLAYRVQSRSTDTKTTICALLNDVPFGNSLNGLWLPDSRTQDTIALAGVFSSFSYDWLLRRRLSSANINSFYLDETPLPANLGSALSFLSTCVARLNFSNPSFAPVRLELLRKDQTKSVSGLRSALRAGERLRVGCLTEAVIAHLYGITSEEFRYVMADCDHAERSISDSSFNKRLDPKGFWRVDKEQPPHQRRTVLSSIALQDLERIGLNAFLALNDGEGWMLPETVRLADYGLGHDDRAKEHQPVASVLGPRFYDWQLSQSFEESWEECERHAELLAKIVPPPSQEEEEPPESAIEDGPNGPPVNLFGEPVPTDLFGNPEHSSRSKRRR